jgi:hypothetical protein
MFIAPEAIPIAEALTPSGLFDVAAANRQQVTIRIIDLTRLRYNARSVRM